MPIERLTFADNIPFSLQKEIPSMAPDLTVGLSPLRFFTDRLGITDQSVIPLLHPFLDACEKGDSRDPCKSKYHQYYLSAEKLFAQVARDSAEIAIFPWDWSIVRDHARLAKAARRFIRENAASGLKTLLFSVSDPEAATHEPHTLLFRTSLRATQLQPNEYAMPAWFHFEPGLTSENLSLRNLNTRPSVGFCGASYRSSFKEPNWFRRTFRPWRCQYERVFPRKPGLRAHIIDLLKSNPGLETHFVERDGFMGGSMEKGRRNIEAFIPVRLEYVNNMFDSDYALCVRGGGNFSYRFYEALQFGRIPLFINTDCVLPWPEYISWQKLCVWVEEEQLEQVSEILLAHHASLDPKEFEHRQRECRRVWDKHLSPLGFFNTLRSWLVKEGHCRTGLKP
jgi:hypothetical protein